MSRGSLQRDKPDPQETVQGIYNKREIERIPLQTVQQTQKEYQQPDWKGGTEHKQIDKPSVIKDRRVLR